jgi:hypothetical protein|tara:strand:- start:243 stop:491 length:249 start_codon:yes stop_codon:yes gene_type:complete
VIDDDEKYIHAMYEMMRTDGWKILLEELSINKENINKVEYVSAKDNRSCSDDLWFRKGQLDILSFLYSLETQVDNLANEKNI